MEERQRLKELRLPKQLLLWACRAVQRDADLDKSINIIGAEVRQAAAGDCLLVNLLFFPWFCNFQQKLLFQA